MLYSWVSGHSSGWNFFLPKNGWSARAPALVSVKKKILLYLTVSLMLLLAVGLAHRPLLAAWDFLTDRASIVALLERVGFWGPIILVILLVLQVFLAFIPGQALMVGSSYLYGFWSGLLISWIGLVVGAQLAFLLARRFGRPFATRWVSASTLERWDRLALQQGIAFFSISFVLPLFPNDAMAYVAGLGTISSTRFLAANMLGRGMACLLLSLVGAYGFKIPLWGWASATLAAVLIWVLWLLSRRRTSVMTSSIRSETALIDDPDVTA
jgi:uncharacterized membrane protein YdjX (TVP38/TMEM64 family)